MSLLKSKNIFLLIPLFIFIQALLASPILPLSSGRDRLTDPYETKSVIYVGIESVVSRPIIKACKNNFTVLFFQSPLIRFFSPMEQVKPLTVVYSLFNPTPFLRSTLARVPPV